MMLPENHPLYRSQTLRQVEADFAHLPLMQRAGEAAATLALQLLSARQSAPVLVLAGPGNNGGDGFEVASLLRRQFVAVHLVFVGQWEKLSQDAAAAGQRFLSGGGQVLDEIPPETPWGVIVDGLFGIGLARAPAGRAAELIRAANGLRESLDCPLLALDCPSGLNAETGLALSPCINATHTITFIADKPGLHTLDGPDHCGAIHIASLDLALPSGPDNGQLLGLSEIKAQLRPRRLNSHKGSNGSAGILGGSKGMVGAALMAGRAALLLGSGRVYMGLLAPSAPSWDPNQAELMFRNPANLLQTPLQALGCGPGLGSSVEAIARLEGALGLPIPLVLDADALNLLAKEGNLKVALACRQSPTLLTPHPMEAARLLDLSLDEVQSDRIGSAQAIAREYNSWVALKGCGTVIASPTGQWWINPTGNPGMGSAGMGDVLTGIITALIAQGMAPGEALKVAVYLHGAAADVLVAAGCGPVGLSASETILAARKLINEWIAR